MRQTSGDTIPDTSAPCLSFFTRFQLTEESFQSQPRHHWRAAGFAGSRSRRMRWTLAKDLLAHGGGLGLAARGRRIGEGKV